MLHQRLTLLWALLFAFISAGGLGAGLLSVAPILKLILAEEHNKSLIRIAEDYNASGPWIAIPQPIIDHLPETPWRGVLAIVLALAVLTILGATANFLHIYLTGTVAAKTTARIRQRAFERAVSMPLGRVMERGPSEFVARVVRDAAELQRGFVALTSKAIAHLTKGLVALIVAIIIQPALTVVAIPTAIILAVIIRKIGKRIRRGTRGSLQAQEGLLRISTESLQGLRAVKANTGENEAGRRFGAVNDAVVHHELKVRTGRALSAPVVETLAVFVLGALALIAAKLIIDGTLAFQTFMTAIIALGVAGGSFRPLAGLVTEIQAASAPAIRLCEILDAPVEEPDPGARPSLPLHQKDIEFHAVSFRYAGTDAKALDDVSLRIAHGQRVAIVGPNGSGKTTLVSLLPRLLLPSSGRVLIDGTDVADVALASLRRQIGVVTQETVLFRGSVADNIAFGLDGVTRGQIIEAAKRAHAHEFILALHGDRHADGYDADLAEQGASLSGGQRQRLAIARAILRDPSILILDEATSQIDAESEAQINAALAEFSKGRTTIIVAHRLATVLNADRIVVMDTGRIADQGTHDELLQRCDLYRRLTETQLVAVGSAPAN